MKETDNWKSVTFTLFQDLAKQINKKHETLIGNARLLISEAVEIGGLLSRARENCEHGEFEPWLTQNVGFVKMTAYNYISLFNYQSQIAGANNLSEAYKLIETLEGQKKQSEAQKANQRVADYRKTGNKPEGWRRGTDDKLAQEEAERDKRLEQLKQEALNRKQEAEKEAREREAERARLSADTESVLRFLGEEAEILNERARFKEAIRLSADGMKDPFQDAIIDYLQTLQDDCRRIEACHNIIKICKHIAAELQSKGAKGGAA